MLNTVAGFALLTLQRQQSDWAFSTFVGPALARSEKGKFPAARMDAKLIKSANTSATESHFRAIRSGRVCDVSNKHTQ